MQELDKNGYDIITGFNIKGIHKDTQGRYDKDGYDYKGYDEKGFNKYGYNREGVKLEAGKKKIKHTEREKPTKENDSLFIYRGTNARGFYKDGKNIYRGEHDKRGFLLDGTNIDTGSQYNKYGHDAYGYNKDGYDEYGFNDEGINEYTGTIYDIDGFDKDRYNTRGFSAITKKHRDTQTYYDEKGFNIKGLWHGDNVYSLETGFNVNGFNREGINEDTNTRYNKDGYDEEGYNKEGYNIDGYDRLGINNEGISIETGEKDERILFAEEFINSGKSIENFAQEKQIPLDKINSLIKEIRISIYIKDRIDMALENNSNRFIGTMQTKKQQLLSGKIPITEIKGIDVILRLSSVEEREKISEILIKNIASHDISILEYGNIFGIEECDSKLPKNIIDKIKTINNQARNSQNKDIRMLATEIYKEQARIKGYIKPYTPNSGEVLGYMEKPGDIVPKMVTITDEHRKMAKEYLAATDEFICDKTMQTTLMQLVKGQIDIEKINRAKSEKELKTLQQQDKELDEITELAKEVIEKDAIIDKADVPNL